MARLHHVLFAGLLAATALVVAAAFWSVQAYGAAPAGCVELIQNGGFEDGELGWQQTSTGAYSLISDFNPRTGSMGAYLGGVNNADDRFSQQVTLPAGTSSLSAWWYLDTTEAAGVFDQMTVSLLRGDGSWLVDLLIADNTAPEGVWDEIVIDLSPYAGQTVVLQFMGRTDGTNISDFYVDDVSILGCAAAPGPWRGYLPLIIQ